MSVTKVPLGKGNIFDDQVMMYPVLEKHLFVEPYIQMFYCLNKELEDKKACIVIGYSFTGLAFEYVYSVV